MRVSVREAFGLGRRQARSDGSSWAIVALGSAACIAAATLTVAIGPPDLGSSTVLVEEPVPVGPWAFDWSEAARTPAAKQAAQIQALQAVAGVTLALLAGLCFVIVVASWSQRLRLRRAENFVHWAVGADRWHAVARIAGEGRYWLAASLVCAAAVALAVGPIVAATFPGEAAIAVDIKVGLIVATGITVALLRWEQHSAARPVRPGVVLIRDFIGSPGVVVTFGMAILSGIGILTFHAPPGEAAVHGSAAVVVDTSLAGLAEDERRQRITDVTRATAEADIRVGFASAGSARGVAPNEFVTTECGRCFEGGLPMPIKVVRAEIHALAADTFQYLGVSVTAGRGFDRNVPDDSTAVAIVSQALANRHFERGQAVGRRLQLGQGPWLTVIGVVEDAPHMLGYAQYSVYVPIAEAAPTHMEALVEFPSDVARVENALTAAGFDVGASRTWSDVFAAHRWFRSFLAVIALITMVLLAAALSVSTISETRAMRFELGVRRALGASRRELNTFFAALVARRLFLALTLGAWLSLFAGALLTEAYPTIPNVDGRALLLAGVWAGLWYLVGSIPPYRHAMRESLMDNLKAS